MSEEKKPEAEVPEHTHIRIVVQVHPACPHRPKPNYQVIALFGNNAAVEGESEESVADAARKLIHELDSLSQRVAHELREAGLIHARKLLAS